MLELLSQIIENALALLKDKKENKKPKTRSIHCIDQKNPSKFLLSELQFKYF